MPIYEYRCPKCKHKVERIEKVSGPHLKKCPHCGGEVESVLSAPALHFKGAGWYVTDYARKTSGGDGLKSETSEKAGKTEKAEKAEKASKSSATPAATSKRE